jgi:hypothetical protein
LDVLKPPISGADYLRIFRTIYSVLEPEVSDFTGACYLFNTIGSALLLEYYGIQAIPVVGQAGYCLDGENRVLLVYASLKDGLVDREGKDAHCWLNADGWHIDFMAPLFPLIAKKGNLPLCKAKMMCKRLSEMKSSFDELKKSGDFFLWPDVDRTHKEISRIISTPSVRDSAQLCSIWFEKPPQKMKQFLPISDEAGRVYQISLTKMGIEGSW